MRAIAALAALPLPLTVVGAQAPPPAAAQGIPRLQIENTTTARILIFMAEPGRWIRLGRVPASSRAAFPIPGFHPCRRATLNVVASPEIAPDSSAQRALAHAAGTTPLEHALLTAIRWSYDGRALVGEPPSGIVLGNAADSIRLRDALPTECRRATPPERGALGAPPPHAR